MARLTVYVPDKVYEEARARLPDDLSWSRLLTEQLQRALGCSHDEVVCATCGTSVHTGVDDADPD